MVKNIPSNGHASGGTLPAPLAPDDGDHLKYLLTAYLFNSLSAAGRLEVEAHLHGCGACRERLAAARRTLGEVEVALEDEGRTYVFEGRRRRRVMETAKQAQLRILPQVDFGRPLRMNWKLSALAGILMLLVVGGLLLPSLSRSRMVAKGEREYAASAKTTARYEGRQSAPASAPEPAGAAKGEPGAAPAEQLERSLEAPQKSAAAADPSASTDLLHGEGLRFAREETKALSSAQSSSGGSGGDDAGKGDHYEDLAGKKNLKEKEAKRSEVNRKAIDADASKAPSAQEAYDQERASPDRRLMKYSRGEKGPVAEQRAAKEGPTPLPKVAERLEAAREALSEIKEEEPAKQNLELEHGASSGAENSVGRARSITVEKLGKLEAAKNEVASPAPKPSSLQKDLDEYKRKRAEEETGVSPEMHAHSSTSGSDEAAGGGGLGGEKLDDLIGAGGENSPGIGGGWSGADGAGSKKEEAGAGQGSFGRMSGGGRELVVKRHGGHVAAESKAEPKNRPQPLPPSYEAPPGPDAPKPTSPLQDSRDADSGFEFKPAKSSLEELRSELAAKPEPLVLAPPSQKILVQAQQASGLILLNDGKGGEQKGRYEQVFPGKDPAFLRAPAKVAAGRDEEGLYRKDSQKDQDQKAEGELGKLRGELAAKPEPLVVPWPGTVDGPAPAQSKVPVGGYLIYPDKWREAGELETSLSKAQIVEDSKRKERAGLPAGSGVSKEEAWRIAREGKKYQEILADEIADFQVNPWFSRAQGAQQQEAGGRESEEAVQDGKFKDRGGRSSGIILPVAPASDGGINVNDMYDLGKSAPPGEAKLSATEISLRGFRHFRDENEKLTFPEYMHRPAAVPLPIITDEGLDEDEFIARYQTRPFVDAARDNLSTFAMDVDSASYTLARARLREGRLPEPGSVRVEEFVNYFKQPYRVEGEEAFGVFAESGPSLFDGCAGLELLKIGIKSREARPDERRAAALTFVVDASGSMSKDDRIQWVRGALADLVKQLAPDDTVCIVAFGGTAELVLPRTSARKKERILEAIAALAPRGGTNVEAGLSLGYRMADEAFSPEAINRLILCSDGVANVGAQGPDEILKRVKVYAARGIDLITVGFGKVQYNDVMMERLANEGNGSSYYVDRPEEARRIFREQLPAHHEVLARDAKVQVEFNAQAVARYRLLGYENRKIADKDFRNDAIDAGEVAHGTLVTALYEIQRRPGGHGALGKLFLRWKDASYRHQPVVERNFPLPEGLLSERPSSELRFLACVAEFAELLRGSRWARDGSFAAVRAQLYALPPAFRKRAEWKELNELTERAQKLSVQTWANEIGGSGK